MKSIFKKKKNWILNIFNLHKLIEEKHVFLCTIFLQKKKNKFDGVFFKYTKLKLKFNIIYTFERI